MRKFFLLLSITLCGCTATEQKAATPAAGQPPAIDANQPKAKISADKQEPKKPAAGSVAGVTTAPPNIVAKIGDYVITAEQLQQRLMMELRPYDSEEYNVIAEPPDTKVVLTKMIAEKAMVMEGRRQNILKDSAINDLVKRFRDRSLINLLVQKHLQTRLIITESEIEEKTKADPNISRAQAKMMLEKIKANKLLEQYYGEIYAKFHVKTYKDAVAKTAQIHQRLLQYPKNPRSEKYILNRQIESDLTPEEKDMVLATYDNGKVTLKDWFTFLCEMSPPRRPADLNTPEGVERLLDITLRIPLWTSEATLLGLDKDEGLIKQVRDWEDTHVLNKVISQKVKGVNEPTNEQIIDYFNKNKEVFITGRMLKIDQIWCEDLKTAQKVKSEVKAGKDFEAVKQQYSLEKKGGPFDTYSGSEGVFFKDLWKGEPNQLIGPVKGFYGNTIKWRVVKILEKKPGTVREYSENMKDSIKWKMTSEQRIALLEKYNKELLAKYQYEIYADTLKNIKPLDIP